MFGIWDITENQIEKREQHVGKIVSSKTIRDITEKASCFKGDIGVPITIPEFKSKTLESLKKIIDKGKDLPPYEERKNSGEPLTDVERKIYNARREQTQLIEAFNNMPKGFELVPLVYSRISPQQNKIVQKEFSRYVKPKFMRFLAREHTADLKKLGICDHGIQRMRKGLDAADKNGNHYDLSVDHVIERSGSGKLGLEKAVDPLLPKGSKPTFIVNHLSNFILLPHSIHGDIKNLINDTQRLYDLSAGEAAWGYMVIPDRDGDKNPGYVYTPQDGDLKKHGLRHRKMSGSDTVNHLMYTLQQADYVLSEFVNRPMVKSAMRVMDQAAGGSQNRLQDILKDQEVKKTASEKTNLSTIFNALLDYDTTAKQMYSERIVPLFSELHATYEAAKQKSEACGDKELASQLNKVLTSPLMQNFKNRAALIPIEDLGSGTTLLNKLTDGSPELKSEFSKAKKAQKKSRRETRKKRTTRRNESRSHKNKHIGR